MESKSEDLQAIYNSTSMLQMLFEKMNGEKSSLLTRSERFAGWTLPQVFPLDVGSEGEEFQLDFQSIGARATNHLANKLTLALFAPSRPFFKLEPEQDFADQLASKGFDASMQRTAFSKAERNAMKKMMQRGTRVSMPYAMKLLIITGNALKYFPVNGGKAQVYNLRDYGVVRDLSGTPLDMVTQDRKTLGTLPKDMQDALKVEHPEYTEDSEITLYTRIRLHNNKYHVFQALNSVPYTKASLGSYTKQDVPWIPLTWTLARGKNYGNGLVEEYAGDFHALSSLSEAMVIGAAIAADIKFLVDPTGNTDFRELNKAESGAYVPGRADDITTLATNKANDWGMVLQIIDTYEKRIGMAFLLGSAVTRNAERVTAEEIRFQAMELETSLGGVYSRLAEDLQQPMAYIFLADADFGIGDGRELRPVIITGLDALSRNSESENLMLFINDLAMLAQLSPEVSGRLLLNPVIATIAAARGVEYDKYLKDEEVYQKEVAEQQKQQLAMQGAAEQNKADAKVSAGGA